MQKYIRIELVDNEVQLQAMLEDKRLGVINDKNVLPIDDNPMLPSGVSIGPQMVDDFILDYDVFTKKEKITIVIATLRNGFTIVESSACVDPKNYNEEIGAEICIERIKNKVWNHLGFLLQTAYKGIK